MKTTRLIILLMLAAMSVCGCSCGSKSGGATDSSAGGQAGLPVISVIVNNSSGGSHTVSAEVAATPQQHETGLMNRNSLGASDGMLFVFSEERIVSFWMKNTLIPLDMIFIAADKTIVDINRNAAPLSLTPYASQAPAKYVLEVNGNYCADRNINIGDRVSFSGY